MTRQLCSVGAMLMFGAAAFAASPFVGTWKQNREKAQPDPAAGILKIESDGKGGIHYFASRPIYGGPLDGSKRPGLDTMAGDTFALQKLSDRSFSAMLSRNGGDVAREVVEVSADGKTLTSSFQRLTPRKDGKSPIITYVYDRTGGDGKPYPFFGVWKMDRKRTKWGEDPIPMIISEAGGVLTMSNAVTDSKTVIDFAKSEVKVSGAGAAADAKRSVKKMSERSFEIATTRRGLTSTVIYEVSADGKTMTLRGSWTDAEGKLRSNKNIYERQ